MEITSDDYYELVCDALKGMGETQRPDRGTVDEDHMSGLSPEESAQSFYDDWN